MSFLLTLRSIIERINVFLGTLVSWFTLIMALLTFLVVVLRYGFDLGWIGLQESVMYLHAAVFMLGAAFTLKENGHVRVDIFYRRMSVRKQAYVDLFGALCLLLPVCLLILWKSTDYVLKSWHLLESSQAAGGLPLVFVLKTFILCFAITLVLQVIAEAARLIVFLSGYNGENDSHQADEQSQHDASSTSSSTHTGA